MRGMHPASTEDNAERIVATTWSPRTGIAMAVTFAVSDVKPKKVESWEKPWCSPQPLAEVLPKATKIPAKQIEAFGGAASVLDNTQGSRQGLFDATHYAYARHVPLTLSPDHIWLTIAQGFSRYVSLHSTELLDKLIDTSKLEGYSSSVSYRKQVLAVRRDGFVKGSQSNDWPGAFEEFAQKIREKTVAKTYERLICDFSTTGALERAVSNFVLMDAMQSYFSYEMHTMCGIPQITLTGTTEDWQKVRAKASTLSEYGLGWWTQMLLPVLDKFVAASEGQVDTAWWEEFYKLMAMSGGDIVSGHINAFFPFLKQSVPDKETKKYRKVYVPRNEMSSQYRSPWATMKSDETPTGFATVPFMWLYLSATIPMRFVGGLAAISLTDAGVRPEPVWAVCEGEAQ